MRGTGVSQQLGDASHGSQGDPLGGGQTGVYEYETVNYSGYSAAINMGPVALKATKNFIDGAGENGSSQPRHHSEINLSIAF